MAVILNNGEFISTLSEATGFKAGLALNKSEILGLFDESDYFHRVLSLDDSASIRLYSENIDEIFVHILNKLGATERTSPVPSTIRIYHKYKDDPELSTISNKIYDMFITFLRQSMAEAMKTGNKVLDPTPFMKQAFKQYGKVGLDMSYEFVAGNSEDLHCKLSGYSRIEWSDVIELESLFSSESLDAMYGKFIDQRYIDFLHKNSDKLGEMHWRKFEGLTAEYFDRKGYNVDIGSGRNDGGIDVRVWKSEDSTSEPPLMLVQCKRYKNKVEKTVVKALWADVQWENAESGLIVTTSEISPGAKKDCVARGYNIQQADKSILRNWLEQMKTPGTGIFMSK